MKICFLADANSAHTKKWCRYLSQRDCQIDVISLSEGQIDGAQVYNLGVDSDKIKSKFIFNKTNYLFQSGKVKELLRHIKPDILHAHYATSYGLLGSITGFHPYVLSVWGSDVYIFPRRNIINKKMLQYNFKKADYIFSTSRAMAEETNKYTDKKLFITPFGVDTDIYKPMHSKDDNYITIGTIKSLETVYGIDYLIKAFAKIVKNNNPIKLRLKIAGKGSEEENLKNLCISLGIEKQVEFLGFLNMEQTVKAYNSFDIAVFPSISESFGVSAVEAQACGIPVIVSDVGGLTEAANPGLSGVTVRKQNIEDLVSAMQKLIDDKSLRETMGRNGIEYVKQNYDVNHNFDHIMEIYNNILQSVHN